MRKLISSLIYIFIIYSCTSTDNKREVVINNSTIKYSLDSLKRFHGVMLLGEDVNVELNWENGLFKSFFNREKKEELVYEFDEHQGLKLVDSKTKKAMDFPSGIDDSLFVFFHNNIIIEAHVSHSDTSSIKTFNVIPGTIQKGISGLENIFVKKSNYNDQIIRFRVKNEVDSLHFGLASIRTNPVLSIRKSFAVSP